MFDIDKWQEIFNTLKKNKLRTFLTSFSVAWGILMLIILLGAGNGLQNAVVRSFGSDSKNAIWIYGGRAGMDYNGLKKDRKINLTNKDYEFIRDNIAGIEHISPEFNIWGNTQINYKNETGTFNINCVLPEYKPIEGTEVLEGRFLNKIDIKNRRKVTVIGKEVQKGLFKDEDPVGKYILVNQIPFQVVGIYSKGEGKSWENRSCIIPFSAAQQIFNGGNRISGIGLTTKKASITETVEIEENIRKKLASLHSFDPNDSKAVYIYNTLENYEQTNKIFQGITLFIWFIGLGTIIAGVVGVSNIMLIVVKERTREIGIRKSIGASPSSIVSLIISEAVFITTLAGYVGLVIGVAIMEVVDYFVDQQIANAKETSDAAGQAIVFLNPNADIGIAIGATILLIVSGAIAGMIPAIKASRIKPIEALRYE